MYGLEQYYNLWFGGVIPIDLD